MFIQKEIIREALEDLELEFRIGVRVINNLRYADVVVLVATTEKDLHELVDRVFTASMKADLSINKVKTKVICYQKTKRDHNNCRWLSIASCNRFHRLYILVLHFKRPESVKWT